MQFLFASALWALPLVGLPILLHLLFRRKSPVVLFSTIRFIKASVQHTAARKRVQRWLLLASRAIALLLLVLVAAQPAKMLTSGWAGGGRSVEAAIVIDTSYSMLLKDRQTTLLARADGMAQELLRGQLKTAKVAIFTSEPAAANAPERLLPAADWLSQWVPLRPQPSPQPLADRVAAAIELLKSQPADDKWLVILSDFQKKEFPRQLAGFPEAHVLLIDLHPDDPASAGITRIAIDPPEPTPGIGSDVVVDVVGPPQTARPLTVSVIAADGSKLLETPTQMADVDAVGHARVRFPIRLPSQYWMLLRAAFSDDDDMAWDNVRDHLVEVPPRQIVDVLTDPLQPDAERFVRLALDPMQGKSDAWPLVVRETDQIAPDANVAVVMLDAWPNPDRIGQLLTFVRGGGTLIWFIRPGLEQTWLTLQGEQQAQLAALLPSAPLAAESSDDSPHTLGVASLQEPVLTGVADKRFGIDSISVLRLVPFATTEGSVTPLLIAYPADPRPGTRSHGLLYRREVGPGVVYTFATLPDRQYTNLPTHPLFLPLLVRMSLHSPEPAEATNSEIGQPIVLTGKLIDGVSELRITDPQGGVSAVFPSHLTNGSPAFIFSNTEAPGLYRWHKPNDDATLALANVQLPSSESELVYAHPDDVMEPGDNVVSAHSVQELQTHFAKLSEPEPHWSGAVAALLLLLCAEAFMASIARLWKPPSIKALFQMSSRH